MDGSFRIFDKSAVLHFTWAFWYVSRSIMSVPSSKLTQRRLNLSSTNVRQELLLRFSERVPNPRFIKPYPSYRVRPPPYVAIHIKPRLSS